MKRTRAAVAVLAAIPLILAAGCDGGGGEKAAGHGTKPETSGKPYSGPLAKEAWSSLGGGHSRIEVKDVERYSDRSLLRFYLSNPEKQARTSTFATSIGGAAYGDMDFKLVDPVGHTAYTPLRDRNGDGDTVGSYTRFTPVQPGARYETVIEFPPLPASVRTLTVVSPTTAGEFTGVPVVAGKGRPGPVAPAVNTATPPKPGSTVAFPMRPQNGDPVGGSYDLYGLTETDVRSTSTSATEEKVGLRTDVLFAFDKATLSARAKSILDQVAGETRAKADPAKPPILITGHTDGKGTHAYNMDLSRRRADAVLKELRARLGTGYQYKAEGKGETEPVAKEGGPDDAQARQKNRRVEISYHIKQQGTRTTTSTTRAPQDKVGTGAGAPAAFRPSDGPTVATRTAQVGPGGQKRRMDVKAFYRDGAYLVAVFDITNLGPGDAPTTGTYMGDGPSNGQFGAFSVVDPSTKTAYRGVRMGPAGGDSTNLRFVDPGWAIFQTKPGTTNRGFFYVPAPPPSVKAVTFDGGPFGKFPGVPIR